jgi:hypothetical protein
MPTPLNVWTVPLLMIVHWRFWLVTAVPLVTLIDAPDETVAFVPPGGGTTKAGGRRFEIDRARARPVDLHVGAGRRGVEPDRESDGEGQQARPRRAARGASIRHSLDPLEGDHRGTRAAHQWDLGRSGARAMATPPGGA